MWGPMMGGWDWTGGGWWMLGMSVLGLMFWGVLVMVIVWVLRRVTTGPVRMTRDFVDVAKERYARGEITREEYEELRQTLAAR